MNNMARDTNNQIITTDRDVLQGNYNLSEGIKGKMDVMGTQNFATLAGIDKDIYKAAYGVNSHLTDAVNAVDKDIIQGLNNSSAQASRDLNAVATATSAQFFNNADRIDRVNSDIRNAQSVYGAASAKQISDLNTALDTQFLHGVQRQDSQFDSITSNINSNKYATGMEIKNTQREILGVKGDIEKHASYLAHETFKELTHHNQHHERRYGDHERRSERRHGENRFEGAEHTGHIRKDIIESSLKTDNEILRARLAAERQAAENLTVVQTTAAQNYANIQIEALKSKDALSMQSAQNFAASQIEAYKLKETLAAQAAANASVIQTEALKTAATLMSKMADCCCEIKETVLTTSSATQGVVTENNLANLRAQLQTEQTKNLILQTVDKHWKTIVKKSKSKSKIELSNDEGSVETSNDERSNDEKSVEASNDERSVEARSVEARSKKKTKIKSKKNNKKNQKINNECSKSSVDKKLELKIISDTRLINIEIMLYTLLQNVIIEKPKKDIINQIKELIKVTINS